MEKKDFAIVALTGVLLIAATAEGTMYYVNKSAQAPQEQSKVVSLPTQRPDNIMPAAGEDADSVPAPIRHHHHVQQQAQQEQAQPASSNCNDHNIVGTAVGGIGGGVLGSLLGHGTGKTVTTIGGALAGAYVGNQAVPTQNVTCSH
jgi:uncharacterized protein YcfJ